MNATLLAILAYVLAQLGIGWWVARHIRTEDDYLVAGRNMGYGLAIFSTVAAISTATASAATSVNVMSCAQKSVRFPAEKSGPESGT